MRDKEKKDCVTTAMPRSAREIGKKAANAEGMKFYSWLSKVITEAAQKVLKKQ